MTWHYPLLLGLMFRSIWSIAPCSIRLDGSCGEILNTIGNLCRHHKKLWLANRCISYLWVAENASHLLQSCSFTRGVSLFFFFFLFFDICTSSMDYASFHGSLIGNLAIPLTISNLKVDLCNGVLILSRPLLYMAREELQDIPNLGCISSLSCFENSLLLSLGLW